MKDLGSPQPTVFPLSCVIERALLTPGKERTDHVTSRPSTGSTFSWYAFTISLARSLSFEIDFSPRTIKCLYSMSEALPRQESKESRRAAISATGATHHRRPLTGSHTISSPVFD